MFNVAVHEDTALLESELGEQAMAVKTTGARAVRVKLVEPEFSVAVSCEV